MFMSADVEIKYIEDRPCYDELVELSLEAFQLSRFISALATEPDVPQRATDLHIAAQEFLRKVELAICDADFEYEGKD